MHGPRKVGLGLFSVVLCVSAGPLLAQDEESDILINMRPLTVDEARVYRDLQARIEETEFTIEALETLLKHVEESSLFDGAKRILSFDLEARMATGGELWLSSLIESKPGRLRYHAIGALASASLSHRSAEVLRRVIDDDTAELKSRVSALSVLGTSNRRGELSGQYLRSLVDSQIEGLSGTAAWYLVHPGCELDQREGGPIVEFEAELSDWLDDSDRDVRLAAATCLLQWGEFGGYRPNHPLVERAVRIVGWDVLDSSLTAVERGDALQALSGWLGNREARRIVGEMLLEENWFFGAPGQHGPVHSLDVLIGLLSVDDDLRWARRQLRHLQEREDELRLLEGGELVLLGLRVATRDR